MMKRMDRSAAPIFTGFSGAVIVVAIAVWVWPPSQGERIRGPWERGLRTVPGPNVGQEVEDPALVRRLREAAGASETVDVEVTVFDDAEGHAPAVSIQADDVLTYLGRRLSRIAEALDAETSFLEISDGDGDEALVYADYRGGDSASEDYPGWYELSSPGVARGGGRAFWARRDILPCFRPASSFGREPCRIHYSK